MNNLAVLLEKQGKLAEAGLTVFGVGGDVPGPFTRGIFCFGQGLRPGFSFFFPVLLDDFWANQCTLIHVNESIGHGWTPIRRIVTFSRR